VKNDGMKWLENVKLRRDLSADNVKIAIFANILIQTTCIEIK